MDNINEIAFVWLGDLCVRVDQVQAVTSWIDGNMDGSLVYLKGIEHGLLSAMPADQAVDAIAKVRQWKP